MSESLTPEQVRDKMVAAMPEPLGELHYVLHNEVAWFHLKWKDFRGLFARSPETIELLNAAAPAFFHELQRMMWKDMLLHLCRLTDPPQSMGHDNLTLRQLPKLIPDQNLRSQVQPLVDAAAQKTKFARDWRNRRLAHTELPPLAGQAAQALAPASRQHIEDVLAAIRQTMNCIERHYQKSAVSYEHSIEALGGVHSLLQRLQKGLQAEHSERERLLGQHSDVGE